MNNWLQSGEYAPVFQSVDQNGNIVSLEAYRGRKVLLAFSATPPVPYAICGCISLFNVILSGRIRIISMSFASSNRLKQLYTDMLVSRMLLFLLLPIRMRSSTPCTESKPRQIKYERP